MAASSNATRILGVPISGVTGDPTSNLVYSLGPTLDAPILTLPTLGVATATSINKVAITAPSTSATLTISNLKTLTVSNTLSFNGTDGSTVSFGAGGTVLYTNVTSLPALTTVGTIATGVWNGTAIATTKGGTPTGGAAGQVLRKNSSTNYDYSWATLSGTGSVTSVTGTSNRIVITGTPTVAPVVDIAATYVGQTSITTLGTIATGVWNATAIAPAKGGAPTGGTVGQILRKNSSTDYDYSWITPSSGGSVTSVTGVAGRTTITGTPTVNPIVDISASYVGQTSITTVGTITSGVWSANVIAATRGGTGQTTWTTGDILYASGVNTLAKRAAGLAGQVLTMVGGVPTWATPAGGGGGSGTVTQVTGGTTGFTFTNPTTTPAMTGTLVAASGGTGLTTYAVGDIIYASAATTLSRLADVATGNVLISGGVGVAPSWGKVGLTTHVSGRLPAANIVQGNARSVLGVTGNVAADVASISGTANQVLVQNPAGTALVFSSINLASAAAVGVSILPTANGGTGQSTYANGQLLIGNGTTLSKATLTAGAGITITNGAGSITIANNYNAARQSLSDTSGTITWNAVNGEAAVVTLTNTGRTLTITNPVIGRSYIIEIIQGTGGNKTITTWPTGTTWVGGPPTLSTAAGAVDIVTFYWNGTNFRALFNGPFV